MKRQHGLSIQQRLEKYRIIRGDCWESSMAKTRAGYIQLKVNGRQVFAHRLSYETYIGPISEGLCILHSCDNRACHNPAHLRAGTQNDNVQDMMDRNRHVCTSNPSYTTVQLEEILTSTLTQKQLAEKLGLSQTIISKAQIKHSCARGKHSKKLSPQQIQDIQKDSRSQQVIADEYGMSQPQISVIKRRALKV